MVLEIVESLIRSTAKFFSLLPFFSSSILARDSILVCRQRSAISLVIPPPDHKPRAFTLVELVVVIAIIAVLTALLAPAFTNLKGTNDLTNAAYTIKDVLEQARTYARVNNTYAWVGFYEENGSIASTNPPTAGSGRLVISSIASADGTTVYGSTPGAMDPTRLMQLAKLVKIDNVHLPLLAIGTGTGATLDTRPALQFEPAAGYNYSRFGELNAASPHTAPYTNSQYPFQYPVGNPAPTAQYLFLKTLQFGQRGESRINGNNYDVRRVVEIGLLQTCGSTVPAAANGAGTSTVTYNGNVIAIQISGFGSIVRLYRR
jgi:prepilin-type N-terminal cleavage/methylation domain-containing protein